MKIPKVSVIIPIYNVEKFLPQCVDSVREQTLKDIEIILVDDESPDQAPQLCDKYAAEDNRIKVIHKKNSGLGYARNSGLDIATGEFVSFIDSDDFIAPTMLEWLYNTAKKYDADEVRSGTIFYENGKLTERKDVEQTTIFRGVEEIKTFVFDLLAPKPEEKRDVKYIQSVWLALHSREIIEKNRVRFTSERETLSEDIVFDIELFPKMNCIVCVPECFYHYRMNPASLSHTYSMKRYTKNYSFFHVIKDLMDKMYLEEDYRLHYQRLQFLYLRNSISGIIHSQVPILIKYRNVKEILHDKLWQDLLCTYPYYRMDLRHRWYFTLLKHRLVLCTMIVNRFFLG